MIFNVSLQTEGIEQQGIVGTFQAMMKHWERVCACECVFVLLTVAQVRRGQRSLWQCTSPDTHVQLVHSSTSHCSLLWYTVPWCKHDTAESTAHTHKDRQTQTLKKTHTTVRDGHYVGWQWYLGIQSSISLESSLVSGHPDKLQVNTPQCCTQCGPTTERTDCWWSE